MERERERLGLGFWRGVGVEEEEENGGEEGEEGWVGNQVTRSTHRVTGWGNPNP